MNNPAYLKTTDEWERFKNENKTHNEIIVFKFSPICAQSLDIEREILTWYQDITSDSLKMVCINVIADRQLSQSVSSETGIKHESPQVIWIDKQGNIKFTASHRQIEAEKLSQQLGNQ